MQPRRRNFVLALLLFFAWVGALAWMSKVSGERPRARPGIEAAR